MEPVTAFAPATVSNVGCGFDVLGFALHEPGDAVTAAFAGGAGVRIDDIVGDDGRLPRDARKNTAGVAAQALLDAVGDRRGVALTIRKGLPLSSGLGGSAASAVAAAFAGNALVRAGAPLVPGLAAIKCAAIDAGALGSGLSGSGPSLFALCRGIETARRVARAMTAAIVEHIGGRAPDVYVSPIAPTGARILSPAGPKGPAVQV